MKYFSFKNNIIYIASLLCISLITASPYISIFSFKKAIESRNIKKISEYINYPSLQSSLEPQIQEIVLYNLTYNSLNIPLKPFAHIFLRPIVSTFVKSIISPRGLESLYMYGNLTSNDDRNQNIDNHKETNGSSNNKISLNYRTFSKFVVVNNFEDLGYIISFTFSREKVLFWKLTSIKLPTNNIKFNRLLDLK